jgi:putative transposase
MEASEFQRTKGLKEVDRRLKQMYSSLSLEKKAMKDLINRKL